jgi:hypothetical protein
VVVDGALEVGRVAAHRKRAAQVGIVPPINALGVDDVELPGLDPAVAGRASPFTAAVIAAVVDDLPGLLHGGLLSGGQYVQLVCAGGDDLLRPAVGGQAGPDALAEEFDLVGVFPLLEFHQEVVHRCPACGTEGVGDGLRQEPGQALRLPADPGDRRMAFQTVGHGGVELPQRVGVHRVEFVPLVGDAVACEGLPFVSVRGQIGVACGLQEEEGGKLRQEEAGEVVDVLVVGQDNGADAVGGETLAEAALALLAPLQREHKDSL